MSLAEGPDVEAGADAIVVVAVELRTPEYMVELAVWSAMCSSAFDIKPDVFGVFWRLGNATTMNAESTAEYKPA